MTERHLPVRLFAVVFVAALVAACGSTLPPPQAPSAPRERVVTGEVSWLDAADQRLEVRDRGARVLARFDASTEVTFEGRSYEAVDLEVGDRVRIDAVSRGYEDLYAERIEVLESISHAPGGGVPNAPAPGAPAPGGPVVGVDELAGEVSAVYSSQQEIRVLTSDGDRVVSYDGRTRVLYRGNEYVPENLEAGDVVRIAVDRPGARRPYAERIEVTQSVQDRPGYRPGDAPGGTPGGTPGDSPGGEVGARDELVGRVEWIDDRGGELAVRTDVGDLVAVDIPFNATPEVRDWFQRVRRGDRVRLEVEWVARDAGSRRAELIRVRS